ncbi:MAG: hypothetical protein DRQ47_01445, partial [Gammaproteobacteria bacterium]
MNNNDKKLGMDRLISRRDVLHSIGSVTAGIVTTGALLSSAAPSAALATPATTISNYPPLRTGLRGNHPGSFDVAHQLAREGRVDWGALLEPDPVIYDLVVVGAGISGLASAHFYQKQHPDARILLLDNHDDFGGHAKRNEFHTEKGTVIGYGGAQTLQEPSSYSDIVKGLLKDLDIEVQRLEKAYDQKFYKKHGLHAGIHFNNKAWGEDKVVPFDLGALGSYMPLAPSVLSSDSAVDEMPISDAAKTEFRRLLQLDKDLIPEIPAAKKRRYLKSISYYRFLEKHLDIHEPEVFAVLQDLVSDFGVGIDAATALSALEYAELPGRKAAGLPPQEEEEAYIHHFPDGNA